MGEVIGHAPRSSAANAAIPCDNYEHFSHDLTLLLLNFAVLKADEYESLMRGL